MRRGRVGSRGCMPWSVRAAGWDGPGPDRSSHADPPVALADLDLAEPGAGELGDDRGNERLGQAREARVVRLALRRVAIAGGCVIGHRLDVLARGWLVASTGGRRGGRPLAGPEQPPPAGPPAPSP